MFADHENIQLDIQLHFSKQTCSCTNANHFWTQLVYYHIHTSYLFYRLEIPLWWILLFVHCYISTVLPLEISMALVAESFSCYLFQQENTLFFLYLLKITIIQIQENGFIQNKGKGIRKDWTLRIRGSDKWLNFMCFYKHIMEVRIQI